MPCVAAPIGSVWDAGSWSDTAWCLGTWAGAVTPPVVVQTGGWYAPALDLPYNEDDEIFMLLLTEILLNE